MKQACEILAALMLLVSVAQAEETRLVCEGVVAGYHSEYAGQTTNQITGATKKNYVSVPFESAVVREIRFDEQAGTFWYKGGKGLSDDGMADGWIPAKTVKFSEGSIDVVFRSGPSRALKAVLSLGVSELGDKVKSIGTLDRFTGIWRMQGATLNCRMVETDERKF